MHMENVHSVNSKVSGVKTRGFLLSSGVGYNLGLQCERRGAHYRYKGLNICNDMFALIYREVSLAGYL